MPRANTAAWLVMPPRTGDNALGRMHAMDIFRAGFRKRQNDAVIFGGQLFRLPLP